MNIMRYFIPSAVAVVAAAGFTSCLGDDDNTYDYNEWKNQNENYYTRMQDTVGADGQKVYEKIVPIWAPGVSILAKWHNDRSLTAGNLIPMDNSTVDIVYEGKYYNGVRFDSSFSRTEHGDSIYRCMPKNMVSGFWTMLTNMHVGDSVTCIIPYSAGYGASSSGIMPYSTLVFEIKLKSIYKYEMADR